MRLALQMKKQVMATVHNSEGSVSTIGGTLLAFIGIVDGSDIIKTGILACVGAIASFGMSRLMQVIWPAKARDES